MAFELKKMMLLFVVPALFSSYPCVKGFSLVRKNEGRRLYQECFPIESPTAKNYAAPRSLHGLHAHTDNDAALNVHEKTGEGKSIHFELEEDELRDQPSRRAVLLGLAVMTGAFATTTSDPCAADASTVLQSSSSMAHPPRPSNWKDSSSLNAPRSTSLDIASTTASSAVDWQAIFKKASKRALGGGKAGASAAVVQVCSLMWLRTSMNYQYRYGGNLSSSLQTLWQQGGLARLYQGLPFALIQGPLTRFGDTAANVGILALLESLEETRDWPLPLKTAMGSIAAGLWRIVLMPVDAAKTSMQVEGQEGLERLWSSAVSQGPAPLYRGALAQGAATAVGHFPWFATFNYLDAQLPVVDASDDLLLSLARSALLGLCASCVSDCTSNSLRVIKTTKQTAQLNKDGSQQELSYPQIVAMIVEQDGIQGLLGRGLQTRLLTNAIQGAVFSVLWKYFQQVGAMQ